MGKIILKGLMLIGIVAVLGFWPGEPPLVVGLLAAILCFVLALLVIILLALKELGILPGGTAASSYQTAVFNGIGVRYTWDLNGGGIIFAHEFVRIIRNKIGKVGTVFEYGAGPGFIGFSLLANGLCDQLVLADVNPKAIEAIKETIKQNNLKDKVRVYLSDCLDSIPKTERWDLVVSNPPWAITPRGISAIRVYDPGGSVHDKFYRDIGKFLDEDGSILFIEGGEYTRVGHFQGMIDKNGLKVVESFPAVPVLGVLRKLNEYKGISWMAAVFIRLSLCFREGYFIWSERSGQR
jgi:SAM-dependent methyltransferase